MTQEGYELVYTVKGAEPMVLEEGEDYNVRYEKNVKAGTATIYFDGCGRFSGTMKKTFKITPVMVAESDEIAIRVEDGVLEDGKPVTPEVSVYFKDEELTLGKDYTVKYSNNKAVASAEDEKAPTVTITFKGSFKGGLKEGKGVMEDAEGIRYEGTFHNDLKDGLFVETDKSGNVIREVTYVKGIEQTKHTAHN